MVSKIVAKLGYDPVTALGGKQALELADQRLPQAFVVDVNMPEMNGLQVLEALRDDDRFKEAPIVMLTSVTDEDVVRKSIQGKVTGYILKDDSTVILKRLRAYLG